MRTVVGLGASCAMLAVVAVLSAQQPNFKRTVLQQADLSAPGREVITAAVEFEPGASPGRHTHAGEEVGYVIEGMITVQQDGKPDVMKHPGEAFVIPAGAIHNAMNSSTGKARLVVTYIVEKGKPLATPAK